MQTRHVTLIALLALAACVAPPPPAAPKPAPISPPVVAAPAPAPRLNGDWNDWPFTPGEWTYRRDARGSIGLFGTMGQNARVTLRCDMQAGRLYLSRQGSGAGHRMTVRTSSMMKEFTATPTGGAPAYLATEIMPSDAILDAMAFSRGRVLVDVEGQQPTILPSWAEITRIVEDCRR
nr:hypothetical protein [uncultured Sphingorhabdus sp.]